VNDDKQSQENDKSKELPLENRSRCYCGMEAPNGICSCCAAKESSGEPIPASCAENARCCG
jgi:hypothetical protein